MLKRTITAVVGIALFIPVLWFSDTFLFVAAFSLLSLIGNYELIRCIGMEKNLALTIPQYIISALFPFLMRFGGMDQRAFMIAIFAEMVYLIYMLAMAVFSHGKIKVNSCTMLFAIGFYINMGFSSVVLIRDFDEIGKYVFLLVFVGSWVTDIFAYFCGMAFGRHKLIPDVSPKKTIEGSIGGAVFCGLAFALYGLILSNYFSVSLNIVALAVFGIIISFVSQIGDLSASLIKREYGIKDYGNCFPGHGGVLDRFDSTIAVGMILLVLLYVYKIV